MKYNEIQKLFGMPENPNADLENLVGTPVENSAPVAVSQQAPAPIAPVQPQDIPVDQPEMPKEESALERLERLSQEMQQARGKDLEDARRRQMYQDMLSGVNSNLGLIVGGAQAMNTKAAVQAPKTGEIKQRDLVGEIDNRYKTDQAAMMDKYRALLSAQEDARKAADNDWYKRQMLEERRLDRDARKDMFDRGQDYREEKGNRLSDKQTGEIESLDNALSMVDTIEMEKPKFNTGPIKNRAQGALSLVGLEDPEYAAFKARTIDTLSDYVKSKSGLQVTDAERRALAEVVPNSSMDDDTFNSTLNVFKERLNSIRGQKVDIFGKQGKDSAAFSERANNAPQDTKTVNGVVYKKVPGGWQKVK
jgi:hypothetical protein